MLGEGGGFVAKLNRTGTEVVWFSWLEPTSRLELTGGDEPIVVTGDHLTKLSADGAAIAWQTTTMGAPVKAFAVSPGGAIAVLAGSHATVLAADGKTTKIDVPDVGRSNPSAVAIEPTTGDLFVSGDHNAGYGTCGGPWRSPFIFRYDQTAKQTWKLYDYPGQAACDVGLAADSFFSQLLFTADGTLFTTGGSDGGNTVLGKLASDLAQDNPALSGACFASPCYGWKGAAAPRYVGRMKPDFSDFDRSTFVVAHFNKAPAACSCDVPQDDGSAARANSAGLDYVFPTSTGDVVGAGSAGWHFPTENAWFPEAAYTPGYPAVVSILDRDLKTMKMATILPGTAATQAAAFRGGRLVVVGSAPDNRMWTPPAGQENLAQATIAATPVGASLQADFGGGTQDGFLYVACITDDGECGAAPAPEGAGGGGTTSPSAGASSGGATDLVPGGGQLGSVGAGGTNAASGAGAVSAPTTSSAANSGCGCAFPKRSSKDFWLLAAAAALTVGQIRRRSAQRWTSLGRGERRRESLDVE